ncbi:hypothetical protein BSKO_00070 [Bryopsis sp. KO-2023]|nr:hypothetical protein BSKO_00070 [Bryopsis sp. KO-2023]
MALGLPNPDRTPVQGHMEREAIKKHWELVDMVTQEVSRQVASNCMDRARVLEQVRLRYKEMFDVFFNGCCYAHETQLSLQQTIVDLEELLERRKQQFEELQLDHNKLEIQLQTTQDDLDIVADEKKELHQSSKEAISQLQNDRQLLEREVLYYEMRLQEMEKEREKYVNDAVGKLEDDLVTAIEERDDLRERIRFMEKQLCKARDERRRRINFITTSTQTDKTGFNAAHEVDVLSDGDGFETRAKSRLSTLGSEVFSAENGSEASTHSTPGSPKTRRAKGKHRRQKKKQDLGGFTNMIAVTKSGRTKGRQWVLKNIGQIYVDRIHANAVDDREQAFRSEICDYVLDWHLNRYGLRNLAEINLVDLAASVRSHAKHSAKIKIFGTFCGLEEEGQAMCELDAVNFYLVCLQHLAHPFGVMALFPENSDDGACSLKNAQAVTALKNIFREMDDPDGARTFTSHKLEPVQSPDGSVDVDTLTLLLLDEWAIRRDQNTKDLTALFEGGDRDQDGNLAFDEFTDVMKHVLPPSHSKEEDHTMTRYFREAVNIQKGGNAVQLPAFLAVARKHGLAYWHLRYRELAFAPATEDWSIPTDSKKPLTEEAIFEGVHRSVAELIGGDRAPVWAREFLTVAHSTG